MRSVDSLKKLKEIVQVFIRLGVFGFGGPAAHIAFMQLEVVEKKKWLSEEHFLDLIGATSLIPGPNSTEMTMHCGYEKAGSKGLLVAGLSFILPAVLLTAFLAWGYAEYGSIPQLDPILKGLQTIVIPLILSAGIKLGKKALSSPPLIGLGLLALTLFILGTPSILVLVLAGGLSWIFAQSKSRGMFSNGVLLVLLPIAQEKLMSKAQIFLTFLKIGAILYGSGYVLFAFLDDALVQTGFLSTPQLLDAVAVGQLTPGPVLSTATFIGWQLGGPWGAAWATLGIFLPSFVFVYFLTPILPKLRKNIHFKAVLQGVNAAAVALIIGVAVQMAETVIPNWKGLFILFIGMIYLFVFKGKNAVALILTGGLLGYGLYG